MLNVSFAVVPYACGCGKCKGWMVERALTTPSTRHTDLFPRVFKSKEQADILCTLLRQLVSWESLVLLLNGPPPAASGRSGDGLHSGISPDT